MTSMNRYPTQKTLDDHTSDPPARIYTPTSNSSSDARSAVERRTTATCP